jgi:hypothetical protein
MSSGAQRDDEEEPRGPNLTLLYTLIALAFAAAIGCALMIVFPFYHRH